MARDFKRPIRIFVGLGFPREIDSLLDAWQILTEWPAGSRRCEHATAVEACGEAFTNPKKVETARKVFEQFARASGILAEDAVVSASRRLAN
jgi:hypothetical protein